MTVTESVRFYFYINDMYNPYLTVFPLTCAGKVHNQTKTQNETCLQRLTYYVTLRGNVLHLSCCNIF